MSEEIEKLYHRLALDLRSATHRPDSGEECKCLVRFHNCTPYEVTPFWIDSKGLPIKFRPLSRGAWLNMDTYVSHLWFFKANDVNNMANRTDSDHRDIIKILAIPEETLDVNSGLSHLKSHFRESSQPNGTIDSVGVNSGFQDAVLANNNVLICSLCKYVIKTWSMEPMKVPCPHITGDARFSVSDLTHQPRSRFSPTYIYSCTTETHHRDHKNKRRNIYLVEPFYNLRERCFLALRSHITNSDLTELDLPISLQEDYLQFMTTLRKINDGDVQI